VPFKLCDIIIHVTLNTLNQYILFNDVRKKRSGQIEKHYQRQRLYILHTSTPTLLMYLRPEIQRTVKWFIYWLYFFFSFSFNFPNIRKMFNLLNILGQVIVSPPFMVPAHIEVFYFFFINQKHISLKKQNKQALASAIFCSFWFMVKSHLWWMT
jgi:hypothetical protein